MLTFCGNTYTDPLGWRYYAVCGRCFACLVMVWIASLLPFLRVPSFVGLRLGAIPVRNATATVFIAVDRRGYKILPDYKVGFCLPSSLSCCSRLYTFWSSKHLCDYRCHTSVLALTTPLTARLQACKIYWSSYSPPYYPRPLVPPSITVT